MITQNFIESSRKQFEYYKIQAERAMAQVSDEEFFWQYNPESNSIAVMVKHLWGNMMSRFTDFLTSDGEKEWRDRDGEFEVEDMSRQALMEKWEEGWSRVFAALDSLHPASMDQIVYIRNVGHTIIEAILRQANHYAYHVGQIVFVARMAKGPDWQSLTIPKGESKEFNKKRFDQPKRRGHFSDDYLESS